MSSSSLTPPAAPWVLSQPLAFGRIRIFADRRELLADGARVELGSRAFDILLCLVEARGAVVSKDDLMSRVWGKVIVEENTLQSQVRALRRALGQECELIVTVPGRGYCFVGRLQEIDSSDSLTRPGGPVSIARSREDELPAAALVPARQLTNLPQTISALIGRTSDLAALLALVADRRLVTLTGAGGIGKTTLALETARALLPQFPDGVWLTELAPLSDPDMVGSSILASLGLQVSMPEPTPDRLAAALGATRLLLVVDNCEHVIDAAAEFVQGLLQATPAVRVLATSHEPLGVEGEQVYQVAPLGTPPENTRHVAEVLHYEAVQLFCTRMREAQHEFSLDDAGAEAVAAICRRLDGLPLAIELAAARAAALGIAAVGAGLDRLFDMLAYGRRTVPMRHQTLRATLDWSYGMLSEEECRVLRRLSIFPNGFTLDTACALMGEYDVPVTTVIDCIASLVAKSFIVSDPKGSQAHYRLLETTRAYVLARLVESDNIEALRRRYDAYLRDLLEARRTQ